ncbi:4962_t:CDS:2 [Gigaspora rosea]|nr:4962_t:CDS:2 [Gigaspora rosea]
MATRFKCAVALTSKNSLEVWNAIEKIYNDSKNLLTWPALLMVDGAREFKGSFARGMERYNVPIRVGKLKEGMSPSYAMTLREVIPKVSTKPKRPIGKDELRLQKGTTVRYLLKLGELEGGHMIEKLIHTSRCIFIKLQKLFIVGKFRAYAGTSLARIVLPPYPT